MQSDHFLRSSSMASFVALCWCILSSCNCTHRDRKPKEEPGQTTTPRTEATSPTAVRSEKDASEKDTPERTVAETRSWHSVTTEWAREAPEMGTPRFVTCESELCMKLEGQHYQLGPKASDVKNVSREGDTYNLEYDLLYACNNPSGRSFKVSRDHLKARWSNTLAFRKYQRGDFQAAAHGFATASRLDPNFEIARINLASAFVHLGKLDEATAVLLGDEGGFRFNLVFKALADPELAALRGHDTFRKVLEWGDVKNPPSLAYEAEKLRPVGVLVSNERGWLAILSTHESWGTQQRQEYLDIFELETGKRVHRLELITWKDTDPENRLLKERTRQVERRLEAATTLLAVLGFSTLTETDVITAHKSSDLHSVTFPEQNLAVSVDETAVRVFRSGKLLERNTSTRQLGYLRRAHYLPKLQVLVVETHLDEPEGCFLEKDIAASTVVPLKQAL